jgi:hypothetical protein
VSPAGGVGEDVAEDRQRVEQGGVLGLGGGYVELVALCFERFLLVVEFAFRAVVAAGSGLRSVGAAGAW